jgi:flagellar biogenesis protein FliO
MIHSAYRVAIVAILVCLVSIAEVGAQENAAPSESTTKTNPQQDISKASPSPTPSPTGKFDASPGVDAVGKLFLYFAIIAAFGGAIVYISRNGMPFRRPTGSQDRKLQILEMRPLGNKQFLVVVGYEDTRILLGVTPGKIDYLCPLDASAPDENSFGKLMADQPTPPISR